MKCPTCPDSILVMADRSGVEAPPQRPNPVTQAEMDAGSIELF